MSLDSVLAHALALPPHEQETLLDQIMQSLPGRYDLLDEEEVAAIERGLEQAKNGQTISLREFRAKLAAT